MLHTNERTISYKIGVFVWPFLWWYRLSRAQNIFNVAAIMFVLGVSVFLTFSIFRRRCLVDKISEHSSAATKVYQPSHNVSVAIITLL